MTDDYKPLKRPKEKRYPNAVLFLDTETVEDEISETIHQLTFMSGCMIFDELDANIKPIKREIFDLRKLDDFYYYLEYLLKSYDKLTVFAHNIGFDLRVLYAFHRLTGEEYLSRAPIINQRIFIWSVRKGRKHIEFIDTANLGVFSVEQLGNDIGLPKLEVDFKTSSTQDISLYCYRDCEIIEKFVLDYIRFLSEHSLGGFCSTLASQSLHSYLYKFYDDNLYHHNIRSIVALEYAGYHGGRTEAFKIGTYPEQEYSMLDINSMYASIMRDYQLPYKLIAYREGQNAKLSDKMLQSKYLIAECTVKTQENCYPHVIDGFLCFPVGLFTTVLHDEELRHAISNRHLIRVLRFAAYEKDRIFSNYADFFLTQRARYKAENNQSYSLVSKLFGNSLYGKIAQKRYVRKKIDRTSDELFGRIPYTNHVTNRSGQYIIWNGAVIDEYTEGYSRHTCLYCAGAITANARMMLNNLRLMGDVNHVFYVDTDSLLVDEVGKRNLSAMIDVNTPGLLKLERQSNKVSVYGPKDYTFGNTVKMKGIKAKARRLEDGRFEQWSFQSVRTWLNDAGEGSVKLTRVVKERHFPMNKGKLRDDGWIEPFTIVGSLPRY